MEMKMEMVGCVALAIGLALLWKMVDSCYLKPLQAYHRLKNHGFSGPAPFFPLGNRSEMMSTTTQEDEDPSSTSNLISHNIHATCMPYFSRWQKSHGKVFVYWMGTEPFLYIADPEFLKQMSNAVATRNWGKPTVFKTDKQALFGQFALNMIESEGWVLHKRIIGPAFSSPSLKLIANTLVEHNKKLTKQWTSLIESSSNNETIIDVEKEISSLAAEIIAKTSFGLHEEGKLIYKKIRAMQFVLFKNMYNRYIGVPFGQFLCPKATLEAIRLGNQIDDLLQSIISARRKTIGNEPQNDLLGLMLQGTNADEHKPAKRMVDREVIDECKAFFFAGYESATLAISWTLVFLSVNQRWQDELREEIKEVVGDGRIDLTMITRLKKMDWMMSEVVRLYPSSPSSIRRAKGDIKVGEMVIPEGTNIWIDTLGMHHDPDLWGDDVHEFKPERFREDLLHGGCRHNMGYIPFGFGGRMCAGKSYATMLYKIVLCLLLSSFSFTISPDYRHSPVYFFTLRPCHGVHLIVKSLDG